MAQGLLVRVKALSGYLLSNCLGRWQPTIRKSLQDCADDAAGAPTDKGSIMKKQVLITLRGEHRASWWRKQYNNQQSTAAATAAATTRRQVVNSQGWASSKGKTDRRPLMPIIALVPPAISFSRSNSPPHLSLQRSNLAKLLTCSEIAQMRLSHSSHSLT